MNNFQEMLNNIFLPLFNATKYPQKYTNLSIFLQHLVGFDSVDDESLHEKQFYKNMPTPDKWDQNDNPPYAYYSYYFYANILILNKLRKSKGKKNFYFKYFKR
jgi:AMP deaminase